jgi:serine/threonine protein kinase
MRATNVRSIELNAMRTAAELTPVHVRYIDGVYRKGRLIDKRYCLEEALGKRGETDVWRATVIGTKERVCVRFLDRAIADDPELFASFNEEARAARRVDGDDVARVLGHGIDSGLPYVAIDWQDGGSLAEHLEIHHTLSLAELDGLFGSVARAVATAHEQGVLCRTLCPKSVLFAERRVPQSAKLSFGLAKLAEDTLALVRSVSARAAGARPGLFPAPELGEAAAAHRRRKASREEAVAYMSPEQILGKGLGPASDLWSLGVIACECLTGQLPFAGALAGEQLVQICTTPAVLPSVLGSVPPGFDEWFARAVRKAPRDRWASAREMASSLQRLVRAAPAWDS